MVLKMAKYAPPYVFVCVNVWERDTNAQAFQKLTQAKNGQPPPASSNIFSIDRGPKVVRIMSATACQVLDTDQNQMIEQQNRKF